MKTTGLIELVRVVEDLIDEDECSYDHHGYCQAHSWFETDPPCPHSRAKKLLSGDGPGVDEVSDALRCARAVIQAEYDSVLSCVCVIRDGRPDRETVDPDAVDHVEALEAILADIDSALARGAG